MPVAPLNRNAYAQHPLLKGHLFFSIPRPLLEAVQQWAGPAALDSSLLPLERWVAGGCGDHSAWVGLWDNQPVNYSHLHPTTSLTDLAKARSANMAPSDAPDPSSSLNNTATLKQIDQLTNWADEIGRGYCGWLATNPRFIAEHDAFFDAWHPTIAPRASMPMTDQRVQWVAPSLKPCIDAYLDLCGHWQLAGLAAPYLPIPLGPQFPVAQKNLLPHLASAGGTFLYLPNSFPVPDRALLRQLTEDAMTRRRAPDHLKEWADLINAAHPGKKTIAHYGRLFQLQHHWRALHRRHGSFLKGHWECVMKAMSALLFPGENDADDKKVDSVKKDLGFIAERLLQHDWYRRPSALDHF